MKKNHNENNDIEIFDFCNSVLYLKNTIDLWTVIEENLKDNSDFLYFHISWISILTVIWKESHDFVSVRAIE